MLQHLYLSGQENVEVWRRS